MKTQMRIFFVLLAMGAFMSGHRLVAQTFTMLYGFSPGSPSPSTNRDGTGPNGLILSSNILYGTASSGGTNNAGTVFSIHTDGTGFTTLYTFSAVSTNAAATNRDGASSYAPLLLAGATLYGTTSAGGVWGNGTVFRINADGTGFTNLHSFAASAGIYPSVTNADGANPQTPLILLSNTLYGTTFNGGTNGSGVVFALGTNGANFRVVHSFAKIISYTNDDGSELAGGLVMSGNTLYGTASSGGANGWGTVFAVNTDGSSFTNLHNFTVFDSGPIAGFILSSNTLYGMTSSTVFAINTDGSGFTNLCEGVANPRASLLLSGNTLYGTTEFSSGSDSSYYYGTVFAVNTDATGFTNLYNFSGGTGGSFPQAGMVLSGDTLYGSTQNGGPGNGAYGAGMIFIFSFLPQLTIAPSAMGMVLAWPANFVGFDYSGFTLQCATNLVAPVDWSVVSPGPAIVNGQETVTNPVSSAPAMYYRLSH